MQKLYGAAFRRGYVPLRVTGDGFEGLLLAVREGMNVAVAV
jgi:hypothetical protein